MVVTAAAAFAFGTACTPSGGGGGGPLGDSDVVRTGLFIDGIGDIRVDDNVVAVGTGENGGIEYVIPAEGSTTHRVSENGTLQVTGFNVANGWIAGRFFDGSVLFHNSADQSTIEVAETDLALPAGSNPFPEFYADGDFMAVVADDSRVADGHALKFIDFSQDPPVITSFTNDVLGGAGEVPRLAIDADRREVIVLRDDVFYRFDMDNPAAAPEEFDIGGLGGARNQPVFYYDDGYAIYLSRDLNPDGEPMANLANLDAMTVTELDEQPAANLDVTLAGGNFAYFVNQSDDDMITNSQTRSIWGTANGMVELTETHETDEFIGEEREDGLIGYGLSLAASRDGRFRFIAGGGNPAVAEFLQASVDGAPFEVVPTPDDDPATEVVTSNSICAFRLGGDDEVAYLLLP